MIDKLKKKIFWSIVAAAMLVLTVIVVSYDIVQYSKSEQEKDQMLTVVMNEITEEQFYDSSFGREPGGMKGHRKGRGNTARIVDRLVSDEVSILELDSSGIVTEASGFYKDMKQDEQDQLVSALMTEDIGDASMGTVRGVRYLAEKDGSVYRVVMTDASPGEDVLILIFISVLGLAAAFLIFALIAKRISSVIAAPVEETMQKQKRFIADASHELKTPVAVISANAEVLEKEVGENKWLGYIKQESGRMTGLVNQLLQLSRIDYQGEHGEKVKTEFDVAEAVMEAALPFESIAYEQDAKYEIDAPGPLEAEGSPDDVRQIAGILIDNAFKHVNKGGMVTVSAGREDNSSAVIRVTNTGNGIPADVLPHMFDRFYKEDEAREYSDGSFGLGLAIARALTEKSGGSITAASDGITVFEVKLPVK